MTVLGAEGGIGADARPEGRPKESAGADNNLLAIRENFMVDWPRVKLVDIWCSISQRETRFGQK